MFTFGSLFAGIGGMDLGLERSGMACRWQVEIDPDCQRWLAYHWPDVPKYGDVRNVGRRNLESVDLIAGGFPCQPHSIAGKRKGAADDRNLWPEFIRVVREMRPRYIVAENVSGIVTTYLDTVLSDLEGEAYTCWTFNIPACAFDAPHRRERIFIVAHAEGQREGELSIRPGGSFETTGDIDGGREVVPNPNSEGSQGRRISRAIGDRSQNMAHPNGEQAVGATVSWQERNPWATEPDLGMLAHGLPPGLAGRWLPEPPIGRVATGVPERVAKLKGLGNAVLPQEAEWIGLRIMEVEAFFNET